MGTDREELEGCIEVSEEYYRMIRLAVRPVIVDLMDIFYGTITDTQICQIAKHIRRSAEKLDQIEEEWGVSLS